MYKIDRRGGGGGSKTRSLGHTQFKGGVGGFQKSYIRKLPNAFVIHGIFAYKGAGDSKL